jgi:hypothetical protein
MPHSRPCHRPPTPAAPGRRPASISCTPHDRAATLRPPAHFLPTPHRLTVASSAPITNMIKWGVRANDHLDHLRVRPPPERQYRTTPEQHDHLRTYPNTLGDRPPGRSFLGMKPVMGWVLITFSPGEYGKEGQSPAAPSGTTADAEVGRYGAIRAATVRERNLAVSRKTAPCRSRLGRTPDSEVGRYRVGPVHRREGGRALDPIGRHLRARSSRAIFARRRRFPQGRGGFSASRSGRPAPCDR